MLRRYPYWGWLLLGTILWCIAAYRSHTHRLDLMPERMAHAVTNDFQKSEKAVQKIISDKELIKKIFNDSLSAKEISRLHDLPLYLYASNKDTPSFWNTNEVLFSCNASEIGQVKLLHNDRGVFVQQCFSFPYLDSQKLLTLVIPVVIRYPIENEYLKSRFHAARYIPASTQILSAQQKNAFAINSISGKPVFYLLFHAQDIQRWVPDTFNIILIIVAILAFVSWIQLMAIYLAGKRSYLLGLGITIIIVIGARLLTYKYGLPFNLEGLAFFSPRLYASSAFLPSLGDLLVNTLCLLWLTVFVIRHTPYKTFFSGIRSKSAKYIVAAILIALLIGYTFGFVNIIRSLVLDSDISFDVSHFYSINEYTILGLFVIGILTGLSCLIIYLFNIEILNLIDNKWLKYLAIAVIGIILIVCENKFRHPFIYLLLLWLIVLIAFLDIKRFTLVSDLFEPHMVFWAVFICAFPTALLQYFNHIKERESREVFAKQQVAPERDDVTEFAFKKIQSNIGKDKIIKEFFYKPDAAKRKLIDQRLDIAYLGGQLNKYQSRIYLFDNKGHSLFNKDTIAFASLAQQLQEATPALEGPLFYKDFAQDAHYYIAYIPIVKDSANVNSAQKILGYVFIDLALKKRFNETVYPELLQPSLIKDNQIESEYAYAIYVNNRLVTQVNDYPFFTHLRSDTLHTDQHIFYNKTNSSELWYQYNDRKLIIVVHNHDVVIEIITLFSYLFGIEIAIAILILLYQIYLSSYIHSDFPGRVTNLTLRRRIHLSMLAIVLVSFIIIGFVTVTFFISEYEKSNRNKLESAMQVVQQSTEQYLRQGNALANESKFDSLARTFRFKYFINNLANGQKIDINVFDDNGTLAASSQDDIYDKLLLARIIRPDAWYQLSDLGKSTFIQNEKVGDLSYLSGYLPIRNDAGISIGYINVPFFSSQRDLNFQISNIVVTLVNLYAFIFLISGLLTIAMTRWLTRTFNLIINQFSRLNLQRNERIQWPYDDEIGLLVSEYNKMVKKVEENAAILAQSERESAWREMARQVAHEIKNPLTPMKLNIQYLQQALTKNQPNIQELATKVSDSLIEQIDNLSYIASEFSNFAKMPEARPEDIDLNELLFKAVELYLNDQNITVSIENEATEKLLVNSDRSQLLRVFTNLLENAKQAIPNDRKGTIIVRLNKTEDYATVSISDNGNGIPDDVIKKIFVPYFTTKSSGTGLGLAMTKKIIEFWKGEIWFQTIENEGTTFFIRLPLIKKENV